MLYLLILMMVIVMDRVSIAITYLYSTATYCRVPFGKEKTYSVIYKFSLEIFQASVLYSFTLMCDYFALLMQQPEQALDIFLDIQLL